MTKPYTSAANLRWSEYYDLLVYQWVEPVLKLVRNGQFRRDFVAVNDHRAYWSDLQALAKKYRVEWRILALASIYLYGHALEPRGDYVQVSRKEPAWLTTVLARTRNVLSAAAQE